MDEIARLQDRIAQLEDRVDVLTRELGRTVELIDRYGTTLGRHLKSLACDQNALQGRLQGVERTRTQSQF